MGITTDNVEDADYSGYNSGDEHTDDRRSSAYLQWTEQEFQEKEIQFEKKINKKGWVIRKMAEDGACLFRAVADQIYGDQDMHSVLRKLCIDYIVSMTLFLTGYLYLQTNYVDFQKLSIYINTYIYTYYPSGRLKIPTTSPSMSRRTLANT